MNNLPLLNDLRVFMLVARRAGFAAAAEELGVSPAFVSKRISLLEQTLNVLLLHRTTRRVTITEEGERIYEWAQRILQDVDQMMDELSDVRQVPQGTLRIISSFGFGRRVAPALSALARQYPQLELRFDVKTGWWIWSMKASISIFAWAMISPPI
jgi:LysR family transcriptional activator of dmlA